MDLGAPRTASDLLEAVLSEPFKLVRAFKVSFNLAGSRSTVPEKMTIGIYLFVVQESLKRTEEF